MPRIRLFHWHASEAAPLLQLLRKAGFEVDHDATFETAHLRECRQNPPSAVIIDLSRLPSHGREIGIALRQSPKTRVIPVLFCGGQAEKVDLIRAILPDAVYCTPANLLKHLKTAEAPKQPVKPSDMMNRYGARTTAQKLGVKAGSAVAFVNPPPRAEQILQPLPSGVERVDENAAVTLCFVHSIDQLRADLSRVRALATKTTLWICWCKKTSPQHSGITEALVRDTGLELGLVDYKVASLDKDWSALAFARRKIAR